MEQLTPFTLIKLNIKQFHNRAFIITNHSFALSCPKPSWRKKKNFFHIDFSISHNNLTSKTYTTVFIFKPVTYTLYESFVYFRRILLVFIPHPSFILGQEVYFTLTTMLLSNYLTWIHSIEFYWHHRMDHIWLKKTQHSFFRKKFSFHLYPFFLYFFILAIHSQPHLHLTHHHL